jgi:hypothetical protein
VPFATQVIFITGLCEIAAAALVTKPLRGWAGVAPAAAYTLCACELQARHRRHRSALSQQ